MHVMGEKRKKEEEVLNRPRDPSATTRRPPLDANGNRVELIDCIWGYMGCAKVGQKADRVCKAEFNDCSMIAMGMGPTIDATTKR